MNAAPRLAADEPLPGFDAERKFAGRERTLGRQTPRSQPLGMLRRAVFRGDVHHLERSRQERPTVGAAELTRDVHAPDVVLVRTDPSFGREQVEPMGSNIDN